jgi:hypothetical protein
MMRVVDAATAAGGGVLLFEPLTDATTGSLY